MEDVPFDKPVQIMAGGELPYVRSAGEAAWYLLKKWPAQEGPHHRKARQALVDLLEGKGSVTTAREAFEAAADEAEIRVGGWHAKNPIAKFMAKHKAAIGSAVPRPRRGAGSKTNASRS